MSKSNQLFIVFACLLMVACAPMVSEPVSYPSSQEGKPVIDEQETQPVRKIEPVSPKTSAAQTAVERLLVEGWQLHQQGVFERSNAVAERALRLDRSNAEVYLLLSSNHFSLWQLGLAEQIARQGLPLAAGNPFLQARLRALLSDIQVKK